VRDWTVAVSANYRVIENWSSLASGIFCAGMFGAERSRREGAKSLTA